MTVVFLLDVDNTVLESFKGSDHLRRIQEEAQAIIQRVFSEGGTGAA
jgi:hypothetical protein